MGISFVIPGKPPLLGYQLLLALISMLSSIQDKGEKNKGCLHISCDGFVKDIVNHPAFRGFGRHLLPWDNDDRYDDTPLKNVEILMPYHHHVRPDVVIGALNFMIDDISNNKKVFYDFYGRDEKHCGTDQELTGLFFYRGKQNSPFAVICPGGGFSYVGSLHEGFPLALELSRRGFNAFVLKYRVSSELHATEDLAAAVSYIFKNAGAIGVSPNNYSLWGGSAGARMVGNIAMNGISSFKGGDDIPKPATVVIAYTGHATFSGKFPPTFVTVSENDYIASISVVNRRVSNLRKVGVEVEYRTYKNASHGFGVGTGTDAEGWMEHAAAFWQKHIR